MDERRAVSALERAHDPERRPLLARRQYGLSLAAVTLEAQAQAAADERMKAEG
jgi:hypothetical protein